MNGSGAGGGFDYQAEAFAFLAAHALSGHPLDWFDDENDVPVAISQETSGPGDDLRVETGEGYPVEVQVKHGLQKDRRFWTSIERLLGGLVDESALRSVLLVDPSSSRALLEDLRQDFLRLAGGRADSLKAITRQLLKRLEWQDDAHPEIFRRVRIVEIGVDEGRYGRKVAMSLLHQVVENPSQAATAWSKLVEEGHDMIRRRGRRDIEDLVRLLSRHVDLRSEGSAHAVVRQRFRRWVEAVNAQFFVPGLCTYLPIQDAWVQLRVMEDKEDRRASRASLTKQIEQYHEWERLADQTRTSDLLDAEYLGEFAQRTVVIGGPGSGKSTLLRRIAHRLTHQGKIVFKVRLRLVAKLHRDGRPFQEALRTAATDGSGISLCESDQCLATPDYLLADGLDECGPQRIDIARAFRSWAEGNPRCRICVTTRAVGYEPALLPDFVHAELLPLDQSAVQKHSLRLFEKSVSDCAEATRLWCTYLGQLEENEAHAGNRRIASMAARNPLLLGFLVRLSIDDVAIADNRASFFQQVIEIMRATPPTDRDTTNDLDPTFASYAIDAIGWALTESPGEELKGTRAFLCSSLCSAMDVRSLEAGKLADRAITFWEEHRVIERLSAGHLEALTFVHPSLGEFAAARFAARMSPNERTDWIRRVRRLAQWRQAILLLSGIGKSSDIVQELIALDDPLDPCSTEVCLAAAAIVESTEPEIQLQENVTRALLTRLESAIPLISVEAALALLPMSACSACVVQPIAERLLDHEQAWTQLGAMALALASRSPLVDAALLKDWMRDFTLAPRVHFSFSFERERATPLEAFPKEAYELQVEIVRLAVPRLFEDLAEQEAKVVVEAFAGGGRLSGKMQMEIMSFLKRRGHTDSVARINAGFRASHTNFADSFVRFFQESRRADAVFLEAILEATEADGDANGGSGTDERLRCPSVAAVTEALRLGEVSAGQTRYLTERKEFDVLVEIVRATTVALDLDPSVVRREARAALSTINVEEGPSLWQLLPGVRASPHWRLAASANLDVERIRRGMLHPHSAIVFASAQLASEAIQGDAARSILRDAIERGHRVTLYCVGRLAGEIWKDRAIDILLERLSKPLRPGCEFLFEALARLAGPGDRERVCNALVQGLWDDAPEIASGVAEAVVDSELLAEDEHTKILRSAYEHWTRRGTWCRRHKMVVKGDACPECNLVLESPRAVLVRELGRRGGWTADELLSMLDDRRSDVRDAARSLLAHRAGEDRDVLLRLLQRIEEGDVEIRLLHDLFGLPSVALKGVSDRLIEMARCEDARLRSSVTGNLAGGWIEKKAAISLAMQATADPDPAVRTQAVRTLRLLKDV